MFASCTRHGVALLKVFADTFACRIVNIWNNLPETVCFSSQTAFSQSLKDTDLSAYLQCY